MKGFISIEIPTKRYIAAYLHFNLGRDLIMVQGDRIGDIVYDLLQRKLSDVDADELHNQRYNEKIKLFISKRAFTRRGGFLSHKSIKSFNKQIEFEIKFSFRLHMDLYIEMSPSFEANLPKVRDTLGIDMEAWDDDSMRKDYYRYRKETGKALFYNKSESKQNSSCA
jgi:hypothetical protein